jgi:hypothetical protein
LTFEAAPRMFYPRQDVPTIEYGVEARRGGGVPRRRGQPEGSGHEGGVDHSRPEAFRSGLLQPEGFSVRNAVPSVPVSHDSPMVIPRHQLRVSPSELAGELVATTALT